MEEYESEHSEEISIKSLTVLKVRFCVVHIKTHKKNPAVMLSDYKVKLAASFLERL